MNTLQACKIMQDICFIIQTILDKSINKKNSKNITLPFSSISESDILEIQLPSRLLDLFLPWLYIYFCKV